MARAPRWRAGRPANHAPGQQIAWLRTVASPARARQACSRATHGRATARLARGTASHAARLCARPDRGPAVEACRAGGRSSRGGVGAAGLTGSAAGHARRLRTDPGGGLTQGIRRRTAIIRTAGIPKTTAASAGAPRACVGDAGAARQSRGLARRGAAASGHSDTAPALETKIARAARVAVASTSSASRRGRKGAGLAKRVGRRTAGARAARPAGAATRATCPACARPREGARTGAPAGDTHAIRTAAIARADIARAAELARSAAGRRRGNIPAGYRVRAHRAVSFVRAAIRRRVVHDEDIRRGVVRARDVHRGPIRVRDDAGTVAARLGAHVRHIRPDLARFRCPSLGVIRRHKGRLVGRSVALGEPADITLDDHGSVRQVDIVRGIGACGGRIGRADAEIRRRVCILLGRHAKIAGVEGTRRPTGHGGEQEPLAVGQPPQKRVCLLHA